MLGTQAPSELLASRLRLCFEALVDVLAAQSALPMVPGSPGSEAVQHGAMC